MSHLEVDNLGRNQFRFSSGGEFSVKRLFADLRIFGHDTNCNVYFAGYL